MALVFFSEAFACAAVGLAGKPSCENVNFVCIFCKICFCYVVKTFGVWPVVLKNALPKIIPLTMENILPSHPLRCKVKASNTAKKAAVSHSFIA
jgi:hypothetical protein